MDNHLNWGFVKFKRLEIPQKSNCIQEAIVIMSIYIIHRLTNFLSALNMNK